MKNHTISAQGSGKYFYCAEFVTLALLAYISVVGQMKPKVRCYPDNTQTLWPLAWKLHFSSLNKDLLLYRLIVHFCSRGQKSMYATCSLKTAGLRSDACDTFAPEPLRAHS